MTIKTNSDVAAKVRGVLAEKQVRQAQVADALMLSRMAVSRRMSGETPLTPHDLIVIGALCKVPVATFFGESVAISAVAA